LSKKVHLEVRNKSNILNSPTKKCRPSMYSSSMRIKLYYHQIRAIRTPVLTPTSATKEAISSCRAQTCRLQSTPLYKALNSSLLRHGHPSPRPIISPSSPSIQTNPNPSSDSQLQLTPKPPNKKLTTIHTKRSKPILVTHRGKTKTFRM
jgi:hypothetical protein